MLPPGTPPQALRLLEAAPEILAERHFSRFSDRAVLECDLADKGFNLKNDYGMSYARASSSDGDGTDADGEDMDVDDVAALAQADWFPELQRFMVKAFRMSLTALHGPLHLEMGLTIVVNGECFCFELCIFCMCTCDDSFLSLPQVSRSA